MPNSIRSFTWTIAVALMWGTAAIVIVQTGYWLRHRHGLAVFAPLGGVVHPAIGLLIMADGLAWLAKGRRRFWVRNWSNGR